MDNPCASNFGLEPQIASFKVLPADLYNFQGNVNPLKVFGNIDFVLDSLPNIRQSNITNELNKRFGGLP